jgi:hypothetical protein
MTGRDKNAYYHELFLRGKPFLANKIPRTQIKGDTSRKQSTTDVEINFYSMPTLPDDNKLISASRLSLCNEKQMRPTEITPIFPALVSLTNSPGSHYQGTAWNSFIPHSLETASIPTSIASRRIESPTIYSQVSFPKIQVLNNDYANLKIPSDVEVSLRLAPGLVSKTCYEPPSNILLSARSLSSLHDLSSSISDYIRDRQSKRKGL